MGMKTKKASPYRWAVLVGFMLLNIAIQVQWLSLAPVARAAEVFYAGQFAPESLVNIDFLAMIYMLVYLAVCIPASYVIDTWGIRKGIGLGAVLAGTAGFLKGLFAANFTAVLVCQVVLAISQPFVLNAITAVSVRWFPLEERGLAAGLSSLAQYLGIILVMLITPMLVTASPELPGYGTGFERALMIYGIFTLMAAVAALALIRERPSSVVTDESTERYSFVKGLKYIFRQRDMVITIFLFFIGLGIFNAVSSMVDSIAESIGVEDSDGLIGALMLIGGVIGAVIIPALSDKFRKRKLFLVICILGMVPGIGGLAFADALAATTSGAYTLALAASFILGLFVMSAGPVGFQYAAEVSRPAPEATSQGLLLLAGQITGILFVGGMSIRANRYLPGFMIAFFILTLVAAAVVLMLRESPAFGGREEGK